MTRRGSWGLGICDQCDEMVGQANLVSPPAHPDKKQTYCHACYRTWKEGKDAVPRLRLT
jgi:hypothetical protein